MNRLGRNLLGATLLALTMSFATCALAQDTVLYSLGASPTDGQSSYSTLIHDPYGNLYGTTAYGGSAGLGTVFVLCAPGVSGPDLYPCTTGLTIWTEFVLYTFTGSANNDGAFPFGTLIFNSTWGGRRYTLYGTTSSGGSASCGKGNTGCGTVYELCSPSPSGCGGPHAWKEKVLYRFTGAPSDGAYPQAGLITDRFSNLFGTTAGGGGGNCSCGIVFELIGRQSNWTFPERILHDFSLNPLDGGGPEAVLCCSSTGIIQDIYGTTYLGGSTDNGVVFRIRNTYPTYAETILYNFCSLPNCIDGALPPSGVTMKSGRLYGMTITGGQNNVGLVYQLTPSTPFWSEARLYSFTGIPSGGPSSDGSYPISDLIFDSAGHNLYGTTQTGGSTGNGIVFELPGPYWTTENILTNFQGAPSDGAQPWSGLAWDPPISANELYGATIIGGTNSNSGVVYSVP